MLLAKEWDQVKYTDQLQRQYKRMDVYLLLIKGPCNVLPLYGLGMKSRVAREGLATRDYLECMTALVIS